MWRARSAETLLDRGVFASIIKRWMCDSDDTGEAI